MNISHTIKIPDGRIDYKMRHFTLNISIEDLPEKLRSETNLVQQIQLMEFVLRRESLRLDMLMSSIPYEETSSNLKHMMEYLGEELQQKVGQYGI